MSEVIEKNTEGLQTASRSKEDIYKEKYGKLYRVGISVPVDDDEVQDFSYHFKRPSVPSYDRYLKTAQKVGITQASKAFMLDNVVNEERDRLAADIEEYPGVAITIGNKLTDILGLVDSVNLKKL